MTISITNSSRFVAVAVGVGLVLAVAFGGFAAPAHAALSAAQVQSILSLLQSFGADATTIANVNASLTGGTPVTGGASTACSFSRDLTIGATGADVTCLQQALLGAGFSIPAGATGYFGTQTRSAVGSWQSTRNVAPAVGYFGPISRAAWNLGTPAPAPGPGPSPAPGPSPVLQGGAGDITVTERSSGVENEVLEGDNDVNVLGFEVEADGSDVAITSVRVELNHTGATGSDRLNRYADEVCVFMGSTSVGCADADDFSESSDVYSRNIPTNAIVRDNNTERFYVAVSAVNNIDSVDIGTDWVVGVGTIRFQDATGAIITDSTGDGVSGGDNGALSETFTFEDLSSSGDIKLRLSEDDADVNEPHSVAVDDTSDTNNVEILSFSLDAQGSDISLKTLVIDVTSNSGTGVTEIANDFRLMMGNTEVGTVTIDKDCDGGSDGFASTTDEAVCVVVSDLDDDDVMINEGDEENFMLVADINDIDGGFASGDKLSANISAQVIASNEDGVDAEDSNGDSLTNSELSGAADSSNIEFLSTGISVTTVSTNNPSQNLNVESSATDNTGLFEITFDVTAIEDDAFIELGTAHYDTGAQGEQNSGANFVIQDAPNSYAATTTGAIALADITRVSGGSPSGNFVKVSAGQTARFKLAVTFDPAHVTGSSVAYRMYLRSVNFAATAVDATAQQVLTPEANYRTGATTIGN